MARFGALVLAAALPFIFQRGADGARLVPRRSVSKHSLGQLADEPEEMPRRHKKHRQLAVVPASAPGAASNPWGYSAWQLPESYAEPLDGGALSVEAAMMQGITPAIYQGYIEALAVPSAGTLNVSTRSALNDTATSRVAHWLEEEFKATGVTTCVQSFTWRNHIVSSVIGFVEGTEAGTVTLGAHFDSIPGKGVAPGAEDNGSGTAGVLSALKAFMESGAQPRKSLYFVAFGGEEYVYASARFVAALKEPTASPAIPAACRASPTQDHSAIILDMIGWKHPTLSTEFSVIEALPSVAGVTNNPVAQAMKVNSPDITILNYPTDSPCCSDHEPFIDAGYPATLIMDTAWFANYSCYHQSCDEISQITPESAVKLVRAGLGAVLRLTGLN